MEGRAAKAQEYPSGLCEAVCRGILKQKNHDASNLCSLMSLSDTELEQVIRKSGYPAHWVDRQHEDPFKNEILEEELLQLRVKLGVEWATDDVSGVALDASEVKKEGMLR